MAKTWDQLYAEYTPQFTTRKNYQRGSGAVPDWITEGTMGQTYQADAGGNYWMDDFDQSGARTAATNAFNQQNYQAAAASNPASVVPQGVIDHFADPNYTGNSTFDYQGQIWQALGANGAYSGKGLLNDSPESYRTSTIAGDKIGKADQADYEFKGDGTYNQTMVNEDPGGWAMFATAVAAALSMGALLPAAGAAAGAGGGAGAAAGAGMGSASAADIGMMYAGADAAAAGSLGAGTLTGSQVLAGAGGIGAAAGDAGLMYAGENAAAAGSLGSGNLTGSQVLAGAGGTTPAAGAAGGGGSGTAGSTSATTGTTGATTGTSGASTAPITGTPPPAAPTYINEIASALGMSPQALQALVPLLGSAISSGGGGAPTMGNGSGAGGAPTAQSAEAKAFLEAVMPYIRHDAVGPGGTSSWTRDAQGNYTLNQNLNAGNQQQYNTSQQKLNEFLTGLNPNQQAPTLIDNAGGAYSQQLAQTIFDRTMGTQDNTINAERAKMQARLAEQGFVPGNEGYTREMNRWEDNLAEARGKASMDAQIQASTQALNEGKFTNDSRTQGFENSQALQAQIAQILAGAKNNAAGGVTNLTSSSSAPTGGPGNTVAAAQNQYTADLANYQNKNAMTNDIIRALMQWGMT